MAIRFLDGNDNLAPLPFRLRGIGVQHRQEPIRRVHGHPLYQWIQIRSGQAWVETTSGVAQARQGDGLFLRPNEYHTYHDASGNGTLEVDWMNFDGGGVESALSSGALNKSGVYRLAGATPVHAWFAEAWDTVLEPALGSRPLSVLVYRLLMELAELAAPPGQTPLSQDIHRLLPVIRILESRLAESWTVHSIADLLGVSPQHLGRLFGRSLNQSPLDYLLSLRINRARTLLVDRPDLRIHEIAQSVGYEDVNHFIRRFRQRVGSTPGQFRALHRY